MKKALFALLALSLLLSSCSKGSSGGGGCGGDVCHGVFGAITYSLIGK